MYRRIGSWLLAALLLPAGAPAQPQDELAVARAAVQREALTGFTRPRTRLVLSSEATGKVLQVNADVGERIVPELPFACLDPTFVDLEIRANQAEIAGLQADARHYRKQVERYSQLLKQNSSSESQLDDARHNLDKTLSQLSAAQVQAETLQERRQRLCVKAPAGWLVSKRHVEAGQWVNTGDPLVELGDFSTLLIPFALSSEEFEALQARAGDLSVRLPERDNAQLAARIERVSPAFDESSRKIFVELQIAEPLERPRGGLRAELELEIPLRSGAVLLPARAVTERYEEHWLTRADGEQINVVYLGRAQSGDGEWVRVVSPQVRAGDRFRLRPE